MFWTVTADAPAKALAKTIQVRVNEGDYEKQATKYREYFFKKHKPWLLSNMNQVFTPRGLEKYRVQLSSLYQKMLSQEPLYQYEVPESLKSSARQSSADEEEFKRDALIERELKQAVKPKMAKSGKSLPEGVTLFTWALTHALLNIARRNLKDTPQKVDESDDEKDTLPPPLLTGKSREIFLTWARRARKNLK